MKAIVFLSLFLFGVSASNAQVQGSVDVETKKIGFYSDILAGPSVSKEAIDLLRAKLDDLILQNGVGDLGNNQFVLLGKINFVEESVTNTVPPLYKVVYDIQLIAGDVMMKKTYGTYNINNCIGINKNKKVALMNAIRRVQSDRNTSNWLKTAKEKILDYYKNNCYTVILEADGLSQRGEYDEAIHLLSQIPKVSDQCFMMAQNKMTEIYKKKNLGEDISSPDFLKTTSPEEILTQDSSKKAENTDKKELYDWIIKEEGATTE